MQYGMDMSESTNNGRALLWQLEEIIYDAVTERPFSGYDFEYDENDNRIYAEPTDVGRNALDLIRAALADAWTEGANAESNMWCDSAVPCGTCDTCNDRGPDNPYKQEPLA